MIYRFAGCDFKPGRMRNCHFDLHHDDPAWLGVSSRAGDVQKPRRRRRDPARRWLNSGFRRFQRTPCSENKRLSENTREKPINILRAAPLCAPPYLRQVIASDIVLVVLHGVPP
jgi:hypothetical protein